MAGVTTRLSESPSSSLSDSGLEQGGFVAGVTLFDGGVAEGKDAGANSVVGGWCKAPIGRSEFPGVAAAGGVKAALEAGSADLMGAWACGGAVDCGGSGLAAAISEISTCLSCDLRVVAVEPGRGPAKEGGLADGSRTGA